MIVVGWGVPQACQGSGEGRGGGREVGEGVGGGGSGGREEEGGEGVEGRA